MVGAGVSVNSHLIQMAVHTLMSVDAASKKRWRTGDAKGWRVATEQG